MRKINRKSKPLSVSAALKDTIGLLTDIRAHVHNYRDSAGKNIEVLGYRILEGKMSLSEILDDIITRAQASLSTHELKTKKQQEILMARCKSRTRGFRKRGDSKIHA